MNFTITSFRRIGQRHAGHAMACPVVGTQKLSGHQSREEEETAVPVPCLSALSGLCLKLRGKQGSGPEGVDDLCLVLLGLALLAGIWASRMRFGP